MSGEKRIRELKYRIKILIVIGKKYRKLFEGCDKGYENCIDEIIELRKHKEGLYKLLHNKQNKEES